VRRAQLRWWVGSNGNLFADWYGFRYCIYPSVGGGDAPKFAGTLMVARNGVDLQTFPTVDAAKEFVAGYAPHHKLISPCPSMPPENEDSFALAMARVEELREAKRADIARRDRAEWECFMHFACENSLLRRQAE
jgi:hypothetical protein